MSRRDVSLGMLMSFRFWLVSVVVVGTFPVLVLSAQEETANRRERPERE